MRSSGADNQGGCAPWDGALLLMVSKSANVSERETPRGAVLVAVVAKRRRTGAGARICRLGNWLSSWELSQRVAWSPVRRDCWSGAGLPLAEAALAAVGAVDWRASVGAAPLSCAAIAAVVAIALLWLRAVLSAAATVGCMVRLSRSWLCVCPWLYCRLYCLPFTVIVDNIGELKGQLGDWVVADPPGAEGGNPGTQRGRLCVGVCLGAEKAPKVAAC